LSSLIVLCLKTFTNICFMQVDANDYCNIVDWL